MPQATPLTQRMIRLMLIGPLPPPMGGATRHFLTIVEDLSAQDGFRVTTIDTSRGERHSQPLFNLLAGLRTIFAMLRHLWQVDVVSYHASNRGAFHFGPFIVALSRLAGRPVMVRIFGGSFGDYYQARGRLGRAIVRRFVLSADVVLLQTRRAIAQLESVASGRLVWFSTYIRSPSVLERQAASGATPATCSRFVYLGHLWRAKGIETLLESAPLLPRDASIDLYGPLDEYTVDDIRLRGQGRVRYCGLLSHAEVDARLWSYDCLVLPTFHESEGYPAVLAEAFAHGIPVVTTRWLSIPEIVDESCGILIEPRDTRAFVEAISRLSADPALWRKLKAGAAARAAQFDHTHWSRVFEQICGQLAQA
jgi:glycosyltransferase involved in cell wall biosynthesis